MSYTTLSTYLVTLADEGDQTLFVPPGNESLVDALNDDMLLTVLSEAATLAGDRSVLTLPQTQRAGARALLTAIADSYEGDVLSDEARALAGALVN
jgi:hypothetical protein